MPLLDAAGGVWGVLDADADTLSAFDADDAAGLEAVARILSARLPENGR